MPGTYDANQATGSRTQMWMNKETDWGVKGADAWRALRVVGGESLSQNLTIYRSNEIRDDRMRNLSVRGTQRPAGGIPFELSPRGWNPMWWHLLGGTVTTTGTGPYTHKIKGSRTLPVGFTIEKGFLDLDAGAKGFFAYLGCRVDKATLNFNVDQIAGGAFDVFMREAKAPSLTSLNAGASPTLFQDDPYTSAQCVLYEGATLEVLAVVEQASITIANNYYADRGFAIGDEKRKNLKAGTRTVDLSGTFMFNDTTLYEKARAGTSTKLAMLATSGASSFRIDRPNFEFLPNQDPTIGDDGPISVQLAGEAAKDVTLDSDVEVTIVTPEADITT